MSEYKYIGMRYDSQCIEIGEVIGTGTGIRIDDVKGDELIRRFDSMPGRAKYCYFVIAKEKTHDNKVRDAITVARFAYDDTEKGWLLEDSMPGLATQLGEIDEISKP